MIFCFNFFVQSYFVCQGTHHYHKLVQVNLETGRTGRPSWTNKSWQLTKVLVWKRWCGWNYIYWRDSHSKFSIMYFSPAPVSLIQIQYGSMSYLSLHFSFSEPILSPCHLSPITFPTKSFQRLLLHVKCSIYIIFCTVWGMSFEISSSTSFRKLHFQWPKPPSMCEWKA